MSDPIKAWRDWFQASGLPDVLDGFMKHSEAWRIVRETIEQWRAMKRANPGKV